MCGGIHKCELYCLMSFDKQIRLKPLSRYRTSLSLLKFTFCAFSVNPCNHCCDLLSSHHRLLILPTLEHHINRSMQYIFFVRPRGCVSQEFSPFFHHRTMSEFVYQVVGYLGGFQFGAITHKASMNVLIIQVFL